MTDKTLPTDYEISRLARSLLCCVPHPVLTLMNENVDNNRCNGVRR